MPDISILYAYIFSLNAQKVSLRLKSNALLTHFTFQANTSVFSKSTIALYENETFKEM